MAKSTSEKIGSYARDPEIGVPGHSKVGEQIDKAVENMIESNMQFSKENNLTVDPYRPVYYPSSGSSTFILGNNTNTMNGKMNIFKKMQDIMGEMGYVPKDGTVRAGGTYNYSTESAFIAVVRPLFIQYGLVIYPNRVTSSEVILVDNNKGGKTALTNVVVQYIIGDVDSGETIEVEVAAQGSDSLDKGAYKAMTGAFKYAMRQALMIGTGDDPEATDEDGRDTSRQVRTNNTKPESVQEQEEEKTEESSSDRYYNMVLRGLEEADEETLAVLKKYKINTKKPPTDKIKVLYNFLREVRAGKDVSEAAKSLDGKL